MDVDMTSLPAPTPTESKTAPKPRSQVNSFKRRGKGSAQQHTDQFRKRNNAKFMAELDAEMDRKYGSMTNLEPRLLARLKELEDIFEAKATRALPISTRGIGLLSIKSFSSISKIQHPRLSSTFGVDVNTIYRTSLLQLASKLYKESKRRGCLDPNVKPLISPDKMPPIAIKENLASIALAINQVGNFDFEGASYTPYVDDEKILTNSDYPEDLNPIEVPTPYGVTINNLRPTVEFLSNPAVPVESRMNFIAKNCIPGAIFNEQFILTNPDEIIPEGYLMPGNQVRRRDEESMTRMLQELKQYEPGIVSEISDRGGSPSQLVTTEFRGDVSATMEGGMPHITCGESVTVRCAFLVPPLERSAALVTLIGELPEHRRGSVSHWMRQPEARLIAVEKVWEHAASVLIN